MRSTHKRRHSQKRRKSLTFPTYRMVSGSRLCTQLGGIALDEIVDDIFHYFCNFCASPLRAAFMKVFFFSFPRPLRGAVAN